MGMASYQAGSAWKLNARCVMWCLSEWHCENPLNVFIIIGPKVGTQSLCRFSQLPPSTCVTGLPALLKLLRNYLRDFKCPLIGNGRHVCYCCLTSINTGGVWGWGGVIQPRRLQSGHCFSLCPADQLLYVLMRRRLHTTDLMVSDLAKATTF